MVRFPFLANLFRPSSDLIAIRWIDKDPTTPGLDQAVILFGEMSTRRHMRRTATIAAGIQIDCAEDVDDCVKDGPGRVMLDFLAGEMHAERVRFTAIRQSQHSGGC